MNTPPVPFPSQFVWGAASSSYQIEGSSTSDGKGLSVWDMFARQTGKIWNNQTGVIACDHCQRYHEDVKLMQELGLAAYRFSVSWPRVIPQGTETPSPAGIDFYDRLVDTLLEHKIEPWITLFHWDFPYDLFLRGGWLNPDSPLWFAEYVSIVVKRLSDRVSHWMTLNEPQCFIGLGHLTGEHAPGLKLGMSEVLRAGHHALLAHGRGVQAIREHARKEPVIGWAPVGGVYCPATETPADIEAARQATLAIKGDNLWSNRWWGDPVVLGHYPEEGLAAYGKAVPPINPGDYEIMHQPLDFYGCNIYGGTTIEAGPDGEPVFSQAPTGQPHTHFTWPVVPEGLYWGPRFLHEHYRLPILITENGMSNVDWVSLDGQVHDPIRIDFMRRYLQQLKRAIQDNVPVMGYFAWSILDNFEWAEGYKHRFGLIHVDYTTQKRTPKDSFYWYRDAIAKNGAQL